jgi:hypothetical protein
MAKIILVIIYAFLFHSSSYLSYKRLAPGDWQKTSVTITRRYLPCWSFSLEGNVSAEAYVRKYFIDIIQREIHYFF